MTQFKQYFDTFGGKKMSLKNKINLLKEDIQVLFKKEDGEPIVIGSIDDKFAKILQRQILNKGGTIVEYLDKILKICKWDEKQSEKEYKNKVLGPVVSIVENNTDVDEDALSDFFTNKSSKTQFINALIDAVDSKSDFDILQPLTEACENVFTDAESTIKEIINLDFAVAKVGVGKGEVAITMFSNGKKGKVGDLYFPDYGEVELKGMFGRPGKTGTPYNSVKTLPEILKNKGYNVSTGNQILKNADNLTKAKKDVLAYADSKYDQNSPGSQANSLFGEIIRLINEIDITVDMDINDITNEQVNMINLIRRYKISSQIMNALIKKVNSFFESFKTYINSKINKIPSDKDNYSSTEIYKNFFLNNWGLSKEEIIEAFLEVKNEENINLQTYRDGLDEILTPEVLKDLSINHDDNLLRAIIGAIQISMYGEKEKFKCILFLNENTFKALPIEFNQDNDKENFVECYNTLKDLVDNNKIAIGLSIDARAKGVTINYKG